MSESVQITTAIMGFFIAAAFGWSVWRVAQSNGIWRAIHAANVILVVAAAGFVATDNVGYGMLAGIGIILLSLAVMLMDASRSRWLAFILVVAGILLASGLPFVTS